MSKTKRDLERECEYLKLQLKMIHMVADSNEALKNYAKALGKIIFLSDEKENEHRIENLKKYDEPSDYYYNHRISIFE